MELFDGLNPTIVTWVLMPLLMFSARVIDVSLGTVRIILISKGYRLQATLLGFFEVLIWIIVIGQIMQNLDNFFYYIAYSAGFATGTAVGMYLEKRLSLGMVMLRVVTKYEAVDLLEYVRQQEFNATVVNGEGKYGEVKVLFMVLKRSQLNPIINKIKEYNPNAFYTVEDIRFVSGGVFPKARPYQEFTRRQLKRDNISKRK